MNRIDLSDKISKDLTTAQRRLRSKLWTEIKAGR